EFALTLAGAVVVSGFVALTLSPMMCSRLLQEHESHGRTYNALERLLVGMTAAYRKVLSRSLRLRPAVALVALLAAGASGLLFSTLKSELAPLEDRGVIFTVGNAPEGSTIDFTSRYIGQLEGLLDRIPEVANSFVIV